MSAKTRFPWTIERVAAGELVAFSSLTDVPSEIDRETLRTIGTKSAIYIPLSVDGRVTGAVGFTTVRAERSWPPEVVHRLKVFASVFEQGLARQQRDEAMLAASREVQRLKEQLHAENVSARVVSLPCLELFLDQPEAVRNALIPPDGPPVVAIEDPVIDLTPRRGRTRHRTDLAPIGVSLKPGEGQVGVNVGSPSWTHIELFAAPRPRRFARLSRV